MAQHERTIGSYRILRLLGEGGMGQVFLAEHDKLGRRAAIKVLHAEYTSQPAIVQRFFDEARAATSIADPGIVQIFDFGITPNNTAFIVMELLEGESLDQRLRARGPLPISEALRLVRQVATSLAAAHAQGIIHRDLKPENIYVVRDPEVAGGERTKLLDFGIAKLADAPGRVRTSASLVMGTPIYMSPEQCRGAGAIDHRSDLYSLGCVLFQLLTGRPPFEAEGSGELLVMHLREQAPAPSKFRPAIPWGVDQLVLRCLAKDPAQRFVSGHALAAAIEQLLTQPELPAPPSTTTLGAVAAEVRAMRSRRPRVLATISALGIALGIVLGLAFGGSDRSDGENVPLEPAAAPLATPAPLPPPPPPAPVVETLAPLAPIAPIAPLAPLAPITKDVAAPVVKTEHVTRVLQPERKRRVKTTTTTTTTTKTPHVDPRIEVDRDGIPVRR